jgi:hypothetical protein
VKLPMSCDMKGFNLSGDKNGTQESICLFSTTALFG